MESEINKPSQELIEKRKASIKKQRAEQKKKKQKKSDKTRDRNSPLTPSERESIRQTLVKYYGAKIVSGALDKAQKKKDEDAILKEFKYRMEREIEAKELEVDEYLKKIDQEYRLVGRPKSVFNWREMEYLCSIGCSQQEISGFFQVSKVTLDKYIKEEYGLTFNQYYEEHSQGIKVALRRRQLKAAMDGDTQMLKFLGKNILGQKEKVDFDGQVKVNSWVDLVKNLGGEMQGGENE